MDFIYLIRAAFASIFSFGFLNSVKILNLPLNFPWIALALSSFLVWMFWEKFLKRRVDFPMFVGSLFLFQLYADTFGNVLRFYERFNWYDRFTHFTGGATVGAATFLALNYLKRKRKWELGSNFLFLFALSLTISFCVLYEFFEYYIDSLLGYSMIGDKYDTSRDLLFGTIGAAISILFLNSIFRKTLQRL